MSTRATEGHSVATKHEAVLEDAAEVAVAQADIEHSHVEETSAEPAVAEETSAFDYHQIEARHHEGIVEPPTVVEERSHEEARLNRNTRRPPTAWTRPRRVSIASPQSWRRKRS